MHSREKQAPWACQSPTLWALSSCLRASSTDQLSPSPHLLGVFPKQSQAEHLPSLLAWHLSCTSPCLTDFLSNYGVINSKGYLWIYTRMSEHTQCNFLVLSWQFNISSAQYNNQSELSTIDVNRTNYTHRELHMGLWVLCPFNGNHCYWSHTTHTRESSKPITGEMINTFIPPLFYKISRLKNLLQRALRSPRAFFQALISKRKKLLLTRHIKGFNTGYLQPLQELQQTHCISSAIFTEASLSMQTICRGKWIFWNRWKLFMQSTYSS